MHRVRLHLGFALIAIEEVATGDKVVGGEPVFATPTTERSNSDSSPGK